MATPRSSAARAGEIVTVADDASKRIQLDIEAVPQDSGDEAVGQEERQKGANGLEPPEVTFPLHDFHGGEPPTSARPS
jgi:hypothetical protein